MNSLRSVSSKNKILVLVLSLVILLFLNIYLFFASVREPPIKLTGEQREEYYNLYKIPQVIFLRKAFNAYLAKEDNVECLLSIAVQENRFDDLLSGLDAYDKSYYKSKFIVVKVNENTSITAASGNGIRANDIYIIFQDKPDRLFYALVGKDPNGEKMCLWGFNSKELQNDEALKTYKQMFREYLTDKDHAL